MGHRLRRGAIACLVAVALAVAAIPAGAVDMPAGTRNFTPPSGVPDHFSDEAEPFLGRSAAPQPGRGKVSAAPQPHQPSRRAAAPRSVERRGSSGTASRRERSVRDRLPKHAAAAHRRGAAQATRHPVERRRTARAASPGRIRHAASRHPPAKARRG